MSHPYGTYVEGIVVVEGIVAYDVEDMWLEYMDESSTETWCTLGVWYGATWPRHGKPRGTHSLVVLWCKVVCIL
jgi:hypothetical protein